MGDAGAAGAAGAAIKYFPGESVEIRARVC